MTNLTPEDLTNYSNQHVADCYNAYRATQPARVGQLVDVFDDEHRLTAIGRVMHAYWSAKEWDWIVGVEIFDNGRIVIEDVSGMYVTRRTGFCGRSV